MNLSLIDHLVDWRALLSWPWWAKAMMLAAGLLLVPALVFGLHGRGLLDAIAREDERHGDLQQRWLEQSAEMDSRAAHQAHVARLEDDLLRSQRELFDDDGLASLLQGLGVLGAGLSFEQVSVLDAQARQHHVELPLHLQVLGEYPVLKRFIAGLGGLEQLVTLHELQLSAAEEDVPGLLRLQLQLQAYRALLPNAGVEAVATVPAASRNPFDASQSWVAESGGPVLDQAAMVGHLRDRRGQVALVRLGRALHLLREGDQLAGARVVVIEEGRVEFLGIADGVAGIPRVLMLAKG